VRSRMLKDVEWTTQYWDWGKTLPFKESHISYHKSIGNLAGMFSVKPVSDPYSAAHSMFELWDPEIGDIKIRLRKELNEDSNPYALLEDFWEYLTTTYELLQLEGISSFYLV